MKNSPALKKLRGEVLRSVSRSFYLSLRLLPGPLRDPLSLAYLLARATDTIADTEQVPPEERKASLRELATAIQGNGSRGDLATLAATFSARQSNESERTLIEQLPALLEWLDDLSLPDRAEVRKVLATINRGQALDLERFGGGRDLRALASAAELDDYTYLVAGCVGEFWTRLCFAHAPAFSERSEPEMIELGVRYGRGLQLINILRDAGDDLRQGRCYLPAEQLDSLGVAPTEILNEPKRIQPILEKWRAKALAGLEAGIEYACAIRSRRIRFATALPALIGARTLSLLRDADAAALTQRVKVPRSDVRKMIAASALASPRSLRRTFEKYCPTIGNRNYARK